MNLRLPWPTRARAPRRPAPTPLDPIDAARAAARSTPTRAPVSPELAAAAAVLERATSAPALTAALLAARIWPPLARPDAGEWPTSTGGSGTSARERAWEGTLAAAAHPIWHRYAGLRAALPPLPEHCGDCTAHQTCEACLAVLRAGWTLRDQAAAALLRVPGALVSQIVAPTPPTTSTTTSSRRRR